MQVLGSYKFDSGCGSVPSLSLGMNSLAYGSMILKIAGFFLALFICEKKNLFLPLMVVQYAVWLEAFLYLFCCHPVCYQDE